MDRCVGSKTRLSIRMVLWRGKQPVAAEGLSSLGQFHHQVCAHDAEKSFEVIGKNMQAHFRTDPGKGLCQEMRGPPSMI
jgi:hypothetical protein